ncbi:methylmalonyl-CoA mutase [archaeon]|nr:methylmalonyl-CoA mutase [archaeon]
MKKIKILLAKLGLDVHNRGLITVAKTLCDAGYEIVYINNAFPKEIISTAIQESVDVVGVSSLCGAHITLGRKLLEEAATYGLHEELIFLMGGVFPTTDIPILEEIGFNKVFTTDTTTNQIDLDIKNLINS